MKFIFYNTEQLTKKYGLTKIINIANNPNCIEVWDYSTVNVALWAKRNIKAVLVPPIMPESFLSTLRKYREEGQVYDIGFSGHNTPRRDHIINSLREHGYKINYICNNFLDRDKELAKCKLLLNIHAYDGFRIFESSRCEPWLAI
jgi:hypothetical protein